MRRLIIYDSDHPGAVENKCFSQEYATQGPAHSFTVALGQEAFLRGYEIMTGDLFLKQEYPFNATAYCISDMNSERTNAILERGAIPLICLCTESPIIARDFYINIKKRAGRFKYNIQFRGTAERLKNTGTHFSPMYYPVDQREAFRGLAWKDKKYLVLINRNKRIFRRSFASFNDSVKSILSPVKIAFQKLIDPWIRSREIYKDRIEAIFYFSKNRDFDLFGQGWENKIPGFSNAYHAAALRCFRGGLGPQDKLLTMSKYKFAICFENCVFPGYVTEKIFDCFLAGCIPIYLGAPDIQDFVPEGTFIDYRRYGNFDELENYLQSLKEKEAEIMLAAARAFLLSKNFDKHYTKNIVNGILDRIDSHNYGNK